MGRYFIKIMDKFYPNDNDIKDLFKYIAGKGREKRNVRYYNGIGVDRVPEKAMKQMIAVQKFYKKHRQRRRIYHIIMSFEDSVNDVNYVKYTAERIMDMLGKEYQVYYGVHENTDHLHIHFAVNAVRYVDGRKWHKSKREIDELKQCMKNMADEVEWENR